MLTKELPIQQAKEGEVYGDQVALTTKDFQAKLHQYKVYDLFDKQLKIKQDKQKYIFCINGVNKFAVNGKVDFTTFIYDFYNDLAKTEKRAVEKKAVINVSELEKKTKVEITITETVKDLKELENNIKNNETLTEKATDIENVKYKVERLISFYEQEKDLTDSETSGWIFNTKYDRKDKGLRKIHRTEITRRIKELKKIKEQIERLANNKNKKYTIDRDIDTDDKTKKEVKDVKMDDVNGMDMTATLKQFSERIEEIGKEAPDFILARNEIILEQGDTVPYYDIMIYDKSDARKINKSLKKINNEYAILDKLELTAAKRQELSQDLQDLETYLNKVIANPDTFKPSETPFVPTHAKEFYELVKIDPILRSFMNLNKEAGKTPNENLDEVAKVAGVDGAVTPETADKTKTGKEYVASPYDSAGEAFQKGGIGGVLKYGFDQTEMKPNQKQFWGGVGNIAMIGGIAFVGFKMLKSAFSLFTKKGRSEAELGKNLARLGIPAALVMGSQMYSGEGPLSLFKGGNLTEKISDLFNRGSKDGTTNEKDKTATKYTEGLVGATAVFNGLNYGEMKDILIQDGDHMKIDPDKYETIVTTFKTGSKKNAAGAKFLESIGKDDDKHLMDLALKGMGITRENLQDDSKKTEKFDDKAVNTITNLAEVATYMETKKYNKMNSETQYLVEDYIANGKDAEYTLEELDARGDVFYKETTVVDETGLAAEIKVLAAGDTEREEELLLAINSFYDKMPSTNKTIELTGTRPEITFTTYDQESTINLEDKTITGLTTTKEFSSYLETFKAASLTNYIKKVCKDKEAQSEKPFTISTPGGDIEFDDAKVFSTSFDTEIVSAGPGGSLEKISPTLEDNKQAYCDYLNAITPKFWKEKATV